MSPDVNQNSAVLHKYEVEDHLRQLHKIYSKGKEAQEPVKPKNNPVAIKFKSENEKKPEPITSNYVDPNML